MRLWNVLLWLDCWVVDKLTGRSWEYYSAILGRKQAAGTIESRWHQARIAYILDWIDKNHCQKALTAEVPPKDFWSALNWRR
jgi:hypothetical protein